MAVIKDAASGRPCRRSPTSTSSCGRRSTAGSRRRSPRTSTSGRRRASSRASSTSAPASSASSGSSTRRSSAARAATTSTTRSGPRSWPPRAPRAASAPASAPIPGSRRRRCSGSERPSSTSASCARRSAASGSRALGITEPGAGSDVASIRTEARTVDGGYVVNGSKTFITNGVRADFLVCAVKTTDGRRPPRDLVPDPRARDARLRGRPASSRRWAGTPPTPASSRSPTSRCPRRTCSARRTAAST